MKKCKNCGYENQEDARFCGKCGMAMTEPQTVELKMTESEAAESEQEEQISIRESKKGKKIFVLFGVAAIILAVAVAAFQGINVQKEKKFQTNISNGKRYLEEESYDQAVEAYTAAIEINPKQVEPYRGLAKAYIALDEAELAEQTYDTAMDIISEEYTQKQTIPNGGVDVYKDAITYFGEDGNIDKVDELTEEVIEMVEDEEEKAEFTELQDYYERYWAYYNKLMELQETYGEGRKTYDNSRTYMYLTGLGFAKLFDFNADGKDELLLVYAYPIEDGSEVYAKEVWGYQNSACQKLFEGQYQDIIAECDVTKVEDKYYIAESAWDFWEYKESGFEKIKTMSYWSQADGYRVDGARVSEETYEQEKDKWLNNLETYGLVNGEWHSSDLNATLSEMENTLAILREKLGIVVEEEAAERGMEEDELKELLENSVTDEIVSFTCDDFDGDGLLEAFGMIGTFYDADNTCDAEIWFVSEDGPYKVAEKNIYLGNTSKLLDFGDKKYFAVEQFFQTGDISYVWGVRNGIAYEEDISGMCSSLAQVDASTELTFIRSTYDASAFDMTGHTWKQYYAYWDGEIHEYGAISITEKQLKECEGAEEILNKIKTEGYTITNIFYRENGIININYNDSETNRNATLLLENGSITMLEAYSMEQTDELAKSDYQGIYVEAVVPEIATYPADFPAAN